VARRRHCSPSTAARASATTCSQLRTNARHTRRARSAIVRTLSPLARALPQHVAEHAAAAHERGRARHRRRCCASSTRCQAQQSYSSAAVAHVQRHQRRRVPYRIPRRVTRKTARAHCLESFAHIIRPTNAAITTDSNKAPPIADDNRARNRTKLRSRSKTRTQRCKHTQID
jgi:hypothetical protein